MQYNQKALFNDLVDFYVVTAEDGGEKLGQIRAQMGALVRKARKSIVENWPLETKIAVLLNLVYKQWGFFCDPKHYFDSEHLYLNHVLETRSGMPASLGAIVLYLAGALNLPLYPVNFPTQLVLRAELEDKVMFIDPWNGEILSRQTLATWYEGYLGFGNKLSNADVAVASEADVRFRFQQVAKHTLIREERNDQALRFIQWLLTAEPDNPYEIRDRGLVLANLHCPQAAAQDFDYFIEHCPDDPTAMLLMAQLSDLKEQQPSLH